MKKLKAEREEDLRQAGPILEEAQRNYNKAFPTKYLKKRFEEHIKEANEFQNKYPIDVY